MAFSSVVFGAAGAGVVAAGAAGAFGAACAAGAAGAFGAAGGVVGAVCANAFIDSIRAAAAVAVRPQVVVLITAFISHG